MADGPTQRELLRAVVLATWSPGEEFSLDELCEAYLEEFSLLYPGNGDVRSKFRQLLQLIRDEGHIAFLHEDGRDGWYRRGDASAYAESAPRVEALIASEQASLHGDDAFDPSDVEDARLRVARSIAQRVGQPGFRAALLRAYAGRCCISRCDAEPALEAAHILPYRGRHTNAVTNGLLLRADLHALFDRRLLAIEPVTMTVALEPSLLSTGRSRGRAVVGDRVRVRAGRTPTETRSAWRGWALAQPLMPMRDYFVGTTRMYGSGCSQPSG